MGWLVKQESKEANKRNQETVEGALSQAILAFEDEFATDYQGFLLLKVVQATVVFRKDFRRPCGTDTGVMQSTESFTI